MGRKWLCFGLAIVLSVLLLSCGGYDTDPKNAGRCRTNLMLLYKALHRFSNMDGKPAEHLGEAYPRPVDDKKHFRCPSSSDDPTKYEEAEVLQPHQCSYLYNNLGLFSEYDDDLRSRLIIIYEKKDFHGPGRNCALANGDIKFLPKKEFDEALAFTKKWMSENL